MQNRTGESLATALSPPVCMYGVFVLDMENTDNAVNAHADRRRVRKAEWSNLFPLAG
jgi:hypothetical protein